ncbi:ankyrin repeat-containing domain protein [Xylariales sp. PMI_506]|nr:ankyrin repeat-containing domain protein [Xylariales sp. PMI_506]
MASISSLPFEVVLLISENLNHVFDVAALARTCRGTYGAANRFLYARAAREFPYIICWACETGMSGTVKFLLEAGVSPNFVFRSTQPRNLMLANLQRESRHVLDTIYHHRQYVGEREVPRLVIQADSCDTPDTHENDALFFGPDYSQQEDDELPRDFLRLQGPYIDTDTDLWRTSCEVEGSEPLVDFPSPGGSGIAEAGLEYYWSPLHLSTLYGFKNVTDVLLNAGARLMIPCKGLCACMRVQVGRLSPSIGRYTPLHLALCFRRDDIASTLMDKGLNSVDLGRNDLTVLHHISALGRSPMLQFLAPGIASLLRVVDAGGLTPLWHAVICQQYGDLFPTLLSYGASIHDRIYDTGFSMLHYACLNGDFEGVSKLIAAGADVHQACSPEVLPQFGPVTPLDICCILDYTDLISRRARLWQGPQGNMSFSGRSDFDQKRLAMVRELLESGATPCVSKGNGRWPSTLGIAASTRNLQLLELLQEWKVDWASATDAVPLAIIQGWWTRVQGNSDLRSFNTIRWLLDHGATINRGTSALTDGTLFELCRNSWEIPWKHEVMEILLHRGANVNAVNSKGESLMCEAFTSSDPPMCRMLLRFGIKPDRPSLLLRNMLKNVFLRLPCHNTQDSQTALVTELNEMLDILYEIDTTESLYNDPNIMPILLENWVRPIQNLLMNSALPDNPQILRIAASQGVVYSLSYLPPLIGPRLELALIYSNWVAARCILDSDEGRDALENFNSPTYPIIQAIIQAPAPELIGYLKFSSLISLWKSAHGRFYALASTEERTRFELLHIACHQGSYGENIRFFVHEGMDVNKLGSSTMTALEIISAHLNSRTEPEREMDLKSAKTLMRLGALWESRPNDINGPPYRAGLARNLDRIT